MYGGKIRLVSTQNTYLSISGFEAWTGSGSRTVTRTRTSRTRRSMPMMKMGGFGHFRRAMPF
jgi:hypothetical protein